MPIGANVRKEYRNAGSKDTSVFHCWEHSIDADKFPLRNGGGKESEGRASSATKTKATHYLTVPINGNSLQLVALPIKACFRVSYIKARY